MQIARNEIIQANVIYNVRVKASLRSTSGHADKICEFGWRLAFLDNSTDEVQYVVLEKMFGVVANHFAGYKVIPGQVDVVIGQPLDDQNLR